MAYLMWSKNENVKLWEPRGTSILYLDAYVSQKTDLMTPKKKLLDIEPDTLRKWTYMLILLLIVPSADPSESESTLLKSDVASQGLKKAHASCPLIVAEF